MPLSKYSRVIAASAALVVAGTLSAATQQVKTVFVIALENHNWTQPDNGPTARIQQIYKSPNALPERSGRWHSVRDHRRKKG